MNRVRLRGRLFDFVVIHVMCLGAGATTVAYAQDTRTAQALKMITDTASQICQSAPLSETDSGIKLSGDAQAKLGGVIGKLADLGISGAAGYQSNQSEGVLQKDLVTAIQSSNNCKLEVFKSLERDLLQPGSRDNQPQSPSPPAASQFSDTASTFNAQAVQFAYDFMKRGGAPANQMAQFVTSNYADNVLYFTKGYVDRNTIIRDKTNYIRKWPARSYTVLPGVNARCSSAGDCLVEGNVKYELEGENGELCGVASFTLGLSYRYSSPILTREQGDAHNQPCS